MEMMLNVDRFLNNILDSAVYNTFRKLKPVRIYFM